jgi:hypothetical protein
MANLTAADGFAQPNTLKRVSFAEARYKMGQTKPSFQENTVFFLERQRGDSPMERPR